MFKHLLAYRLNTNSSIFYSFTVQNLVASKIILVIIMTAIKINLFNLNSTCLNHFLLFHHLLHLLLHHFYTLSNLLMIVVVLLLLQVCNMFPTLLQLVPIINTFLTNVHPALLQNLRSLTMIRNYNSWSISL